MAILVMGARTTKRMGILKVPKSIGALETRKKGDSKERISIISLMKCVPLIKVSVTAAMASGTKASRPADR